MQQAQSSNGKIDSRLTPQTFYVVLHHQAEGWTKDAETQTYTFRCLGVRGYVNFNVDLVEADAPLPPAHHYSNRGLLAMLREGLEKATGLPVPAFPRSRISDVPWAGFKWDCCGHSGRKEKNHAA